MEGPVDGPLILSGVHEVDELARKETPRPPGERQLQRFRHFARLKRILIAALRPVHSRQEGKNAACLLRGRRSESGEGAFKHAAIGDELVVRDRAATYETPANCHGHRLRVV